MHQGKKVKGIVWGYYYYWNITLSIKHSGNIIRQYFIHQWHFQIKTSVFENRRVAVRYQAKLDSVNVERALKKKKLNNKYCNNMSSVFAEMAVNQTNQIFPMTFPNRGVKILRHKNW